ncbi:MAG: hypothetical protein A3D31_13630 [Candidatus Fluviicola riflensis]|nr:MAG: hypothetical protein CHH17_18065 [Candidatus Fluviicola riflensis]OGS78019.1 MAG: hypothetical protein A3D31_13630 [Candidatus Fluviicola riflensis]OGS85084.1 MAG: hypothetical protein A2724_10565 [Fluviicola sp. RIFCSPHIGHO2_01_FULL_43_53]OGS89356.1 MAG: hypothetical protein A3E30_04870 [Fluviicola sp. RIFCSPHIGHO2_12_FULL_43_24]
MKSTCLAIFLACFIHGFGQLSEDIIPKDAVTVFSLNNISILQKVSMDELVSYDFMAELQSELFDGSTQGKTLKDSGIDFNQKMNIFYGKNTKFEISGFTFGITDKNQLFRVFDDFDRIEGAISGVEYYNNYFNHLMIKGNVGLLIRVDTDQERLSEMADSIWYARGYEMPWNNYYNGYYDDEEIIEEGFTDDIEEMEIEGQDGEEIVEEIVGEETETPEASDVDDLTKNYYELRDSLEMELSQQQLLLICEEIFTKNINLKQTDANFARQLTHPSDGIFYLDNSRNFRNTSGLWYMHNMFPELLQDMEELYTGNVMLGDIILNQTSIDMRVEANYGEALGSIYQELNGAKFDKNVLKYIPESNSGFFTYNIDLNKGYERAYDIIIPILQQEKNPRILQNVLIAELMNEFINTDAVFSTYKGSMFGTFNGVKRVKTTRIEFFYDEQTFEYGEREVESEEDMPIFTLGFSTERADIPNKILSHMARLTSQFKSMGNYWVVEDAVLNSLPLYIINKNGLFIFTNDEDLAKNHSNGYGSNSLSARDARKAKSSGSMYAYLNWGEVLDRLPKEMFSSEQNELLESMRGKSGILELTSSKTTRQKTVYEVTYKFEGAYENSGKYLLDLVNSAYILSK